MNCRAMGTNRNDRKPPLPVPGNPSQITSMGLPRQSSVYSLTFDEFQNSIGGLGKDFGSMNMDELLKSIWTTEETQAMTSGAADIGSQDANMFQIQRQASITLPRTLSQKAVDEVWRDLLRENSVADIAQGSTASRQQQPVQPTPQHRQPTLGEMTLEEFLVKAGVVRENISQLERPTMANTNTSGTTGSSILFGGMVEANQNNNMRHSLGLPPTNPGNANVMVSQPVFNNSSAGNMLINEGRPSFPLPMQIGNRIRLGDQPGVRGGGTSGMRDPTKNSEFIQAATGLETKGLIIPATGSPAKPPSSDAYENSYSDMSSLSPVPCDFKKSPSKRGNGIEKVVERRQRRMIKNRESAARSRARKQAYTMELEAEVAKLKEQNEKLQKKQLQEKMLEMEKIKVLEKIDKKHESKRRCLRRTSTGPW